MSIISSIFSINSEANASELLKNIEEMFPVYYIHSDMFSMYLLLHTSVLSFWLPVIQNSTRLIALES